MSLADLRQARRLTQGQLAELLETTQPAISRLERQTDLYLSTLRSYVEALGGTLRIEAEFAGVAVQIAGFGALGLGEPSDEFSEVGVYAHVLTKAQPGALLRPGIMFNASYLYGPSQANLFGQLVFANPGLPASEAGQDYRVTFQQSTSLQPFGPPAAYQCIVETGIGSLGSSLSRALGGSSERRRRGAVPSAA